MPIKKSAKKELKKSQKRRKENLRQKNLFKGCLVEFKMAVFQKKLNEAKNLFNILQKRIDKMAKKNIINKNKAKRLKSKWARFLNLAQKQI